MTRRTHRNGARRRGVALLFVLASVALLASLAGSIHRTSLADWRLARRELDRSRAEAAALSGVELVEALLKEDSRPYFWVPDPEEPEPVRSDGSKVTLSEVEEAWLELSRGGDQGFALDGVPLEIEVTDEGALLNVNRAPGEQLANLIAVLDQAAPEEAKLLDPSRRAEELRDLVASLEDWRDPDSAVRLGGAEQEHYEGLAPLAYLPRNGALQTVGELGLVRGFHEALLHGVPAPMEEGEGGEEGAPAAPARGFADLVTVHGLLARVNVNSAPREVLRSIPGIHESPAREGLVNVLEGDRPFVNRQQLRQSMEALDPRASSAALPWLDVRTDYVRVRSRARVPGSATLTLEVVLRRLPNREHPWVSYRER